MRSHIPLVVLLLAAIAYAVVAAYFSLRRHDAVLSGYDLAISDQELWLLAHGYEPLNTLDGRLLWGEHFSLTLALLTPLYVFGANATALLVIQAMAMAAVSPLLYGLARAYGAKPFLAVIPALLWLASPLTLIANLADFHHVPLVAPAIVGSLLALKRGRLGLFVVFGLVACFAKEDVSLLYVMVGIVVMLESHHRLGGAIVVAALGIFVFATVVFMPAFGSSAEWYARRFAGERGDSLGDVSLWIARHPLDAAADLLTAQNVSVCLVLLLTTGGLCLLAPRWMLLGVPALAHNVLSAYTPQHQLATQYFVPVALSFAIAAAVGVHRLASVGPVSRLVLSAAVTTAFLATAFGVRAAIDESSWSGAETAATGGLLARRGALELVPDGASVMASNRLAAQLSHRREIYAFPLPFLGREEFGTDWSAAEMARRAARVRWVAVDTNDRPNEFPNAQDRLLPRLPQLGFREIYRRGSVLVFVRDGTPVKQ